MPHKDPQVARAWRHSRREVINARKRHLYATDPDVKRRVLEQAQAGRAKQRYGVTRDQVEAQRQRQGGVCALCGRGGQLHIDHDHATLQKLRNTRTPHDRVSVTMRTRVHPLSGNLTVAPTLQYPST